MNSLLHKLTSAVIKYGPPIVLAAVLHKATTGKLDVKGAALDVARDALRPRA